MTSIRNDGTHHIGALSGHGPTPVLTQAKVRAALHLNRSATPHDYQPRHVMPEHTLDIMQDLRISQRLPL